MKALALFLVLAASPLFGQTAKVIQLSPEDAAQAKSLYAQKAEIEKKISSLVDGVHDKYLIISHHGPDGLYGIYKDGWNNGFEFSDDYKFIVPKTYSTPNNCCYGWETSLSSMGCNTFTVTPATGVLYGNGFSTLNDNIH